jgi:putative acetyltransferase
VRRTTSSGETADLRIRAERPEDHEAVHRLNAAAFGRPEFYPRFGFERGDQHGVECPYEVPPEAWMVLRLPAYRPDARGLVSYPAPFDAV